MKTFTSIPRLPFFVAILAGLFLAFVGGVFVAEFKVFPYRLLFKEAFEYVHAVQERRATEAAATAEVKFASTGHVTINAKPQAYDGYTFLTTGPSHPSTAYLIDMQGKIVHEWHRDFRKIWPTPTHRSDPSPDNAIVWRYAELFPNGDIIATIKAYGDTPDGYGLVKLDKNSNVIWSVPDNFHHQFSIGEDGHIFAMTQQWRDTKEHPVAGAPELPSRMLEDFIIELSPDGKELSRVSLLDAMAAPEFRDYLHSIFITAFDAKRWDPLHPNDAEVVTRAFASHHQSFAPGMVVVSLRDLDAIILLDMKTQRVLRVSRGLWTRQHDPDLLDNGNILIFDNRGNNVKGGGSRVIEFEPGSRRVVWSYTGTKQSPFYSDTSGGQQRLPNGNTLISEDNAGRIFEVTTAGEIVWEYRSGLIHHAERVSKEWLKFEPAGLLHGDDAVAGNNGVSPALQTAHGS